MKRFTKSYLSALIAVLLAMCTYRLIVVTAIEPGSRPMIKIPEFTGVLGSEKWWQSFFVEEAWQVTKPIIIQNGRGVLLANSWEQLGPKTFKFKPLSMILPQSSESNRSPDASVSALDQAFAQQDVWVVEAEAGAVIHFEEPFDLTSGGVPAIERGQLDGAITITRRSVSKLDEKPWRLQTSDLSIDRRRISTQRAVTMQWGTSIIRGRDLRVMLRRDVLGSDGDSDASSSWGPLDELELYHVDEFKVDLPPGGLWAGVNASMLPPGTPPLNGLPATLEAFCAGRFAFDFKASLATLTNGVHIRHQLAELPPDEFLSHKVTIKVDPPVEELDDPSVPPKQLANKPGVTVGGIRIREVLALGVDSLQEFVGEKWVELKSPTLGASARGKRLRVNLDRQRIELAGKLDQPNATQSIAWLNYQGNEYRSPSIAYEASPNDENGKALHAGWMYADGPGELTTNATTAIGESQVRWQQSLTMEPAATSGEQKVELLGKTLVENKQYGFMTADRLQLWLKQDTPVQPSVSSASPSSRRHSPGEASSPVDYVLDRVLATGSTTLSAGDIKAHVESVLLNLVYVPATPPNDPPGLQLSDSLGNPMYQFATPPANATVPQAVPVAAPPAQTGVAASTIATTNKRSNPIVIHGTSLNATVLSAGDQNWVDALTIQGPLKIQSEPKAAALANVEENDMSGLPWHIEGEQLNLATNSAGQVDLQIDGAPARVVMAEGALEGPTIRLDQSHNLLWMDQPGEFTIPMSALNNGNGSVGSFEWSKPPHCTWEGRLLFDGTMVHIEGNIQLDGVVRRPDQLWMLQGFCQRLDVALAEPIDMRQSSDEMKSTQPSVERIVLRDNVDLRMAQTDLYGNRLSLERIVVPVLTYHVHEEKLVGGGAGWIHSKFLNETTPKNGPTASLSTTRAAPKSTLQGAHLSFRDSMVAFLDRNEVVFEGKIELASGPLSNWEETINLSKLTQLSQDQMLLNCDQLKVYDTSGLSSTQSLTTDDQAINNYNFQALGNVVFEGRAESAYYSGNSYRLTYEQAKDQLLIVGDGRTPALLKKTPLQHPGDGSPPQGTLTGYINSATINVKTMVVTDLQASQVQYDSPQPTQRMGSTASPTLPPATAPNPRGGVSNFFQPRKSP